MGFLDRFKPQPKWKHPDRAIRLAAVEGLPESDQELLESIVLEDGDAAVRRVAVGKLASIATLARVAREDADESVRVEAREILTAVAQDSTNADESAAALAGLADPRDLAVVARAAELEAIATAALARIEDPRVAAVVARQANHTAVRLAALARVTDAQDLLAIATKSEHRDVGLAALERLSSPRDLEFASTRARSKAVARRARALIREVGARARAAQVEESLAAQRQALCEEAESLAGAAEVSTIGERLAALEAQWQLAGPGSDVGVDERWTRAVGALHDILARTEAEREEARRRAHEIASEIARAVETRTGLCEKVEALDGEDAEAGLDEARTIWVAFAPWPDAARESAQARQAEARFAQACEECERRVARHKELGVQRGALGRLLADADQASAVADVNAARAAWKTARQAWLTAGGPQIADRQRLDRWMVLEERMRTRDAEARELRAREAEGHRSRVTALCEQLEQLQHESELPLKDVERLVRDARSLLERPGYFPTRGDQEKTIERLRVAYTALQPRLHELKESEEWRRWANATVQEELCLKAEALAGTSDPAELARHLRDLQQQWKKVGAAPRDRGDDLWKRFKAATDAAWERCSEHFAHQRQQEAANLERKEALCAQAEALADSSDWIRTSEELKRLQADWQGVGPVPRDQAKALWERFHAACDTFFTRRKSDLAERKVVWSANQKKKEILCAQAEVLAESTDWATALAGIKQLQVDWKAVGPVRRQKAEALWKRFRAACDRFFERYKQRDQIEAAAQTSARESLCAEFEALLPSAPAGPDAPPDRAHLVEEILDVWRRWQDSVRPPRGSGDAVEQRFQAAVDRLFGENPELFRGTRLDADANRARMEQLCAQVEGLVAGRVTTRELATAPAATLASMLKDALATNTIGGRVDEDAKWRSAVAAVREAQAAWRRLGPVPGDGGRQLEQRFRKACRRFSELRQSHPAGRPAAV